MRGREYAYDQLGNRTRMRDNLSGTQTYYVYDTDWDVANNCWRTGLAFQPTPLAGPGYDFRTRNNRLVESRTYPPGQPTRIVRYSYYDTGHVSNITIWDGGDVSKDLYLIYGTNGTLWLAVWQEWQGAGVPNEWDITVTDAWEFRYDTGRQRYLARRWDFDWQTGFSPDANTPVAWTDYLGPQPYVDYTIESGSPPVIEEQMRYLAGFGVHAQGSAGVPPAGGPVFLHGDLTRSSMMTTDTSATVLSRVAYTAFGDPVTPDGQGGWRVGWPTDMGTRYQYDGGWGYESGLISLFGEDETLPPVTLQHVGWRWYQPGIGRFVQRDPIGLKGGLNVYLYCEAAPLARADPLGRSIGELIGGFVGSQVGGLIGACIAGLTGPGTLPAAMICIPAGERFGGELGAALGGAIESGDLGGLGGPPHSQGFFCFISGTLVETPDGQVVIEELQDGQFVLGTDGKSDRVADVGAIALAPGLIVRASSGLSYELIVLDLESERLACTPEHPFYVVGCGWVPAGELTGGDLLLNMDGACVPIHGVEHRVVQQPIRVFNITVEPTSTFFVGRTRVLVHNKSV